MNKMCELLKYCLINVTHSFDRLNANRFCYLFVAGWMLFSSGKENN